MVATRVQHLRTQISQPRQNYLKIWWTYQNENEKWEIRKNLQIFAPPTKACTCKTTILQPRFANTYFLFLSLLYSRNLLSNNRQHLNVYTIELIETCPSTRSKTELIHLFQELHIKTGFFFCCTKKKIRKTML